MLAIVSPFRYVRTIGEPANTEQDAPLLFAVAQFVFDEPGPMRLSLNTRFECEAKVRKVFISDNEAPAVRSLLLMYIPSPVASGPPVKAKVVFVVTSELHPFPG
jgi:hypothetical protein